MGKFVVSPSTLSAFKDCPMRMYGQSISKQLPYEASAAKTRGDVVHKYIEEACCKRQVGDMPDGVDAKYTQSMINNVTQQTAIGSIIHVERMLAIDASLKPLQSEWDEKGWFRGKADIMMTYHQNGMGRIIDIKTGKDYTGGTADQLRAYALLGYCHFKISNWNLEYWFVDQGKTVDSLLTVDEESIGDIYAGVCNIYEAIKHDDFPPTKNKWCNWCKLKGLCGI
jgi:hypothetical protein